MEEQKRKILILDFRDGVFHMGERDSHDSEDPKQNTADMTAFVSYTFFPSSGNAGPKSSSANAIQVPDDVRVHHCKEYPSLVSHLSISLSAHIVLIIIFCHLLGALDEMGSRIDELEQSINDLRSEMGIEGSASPSLPSKSNDGPDQGSQ
ncbi:hypothetical protein WN944_025475 [Citrus x changshan-huyou]|uniref:Uncharacterized protein n=1 Tax=Citrus x changshan-huyou TaxID=2935761 RepID=A0AAP0QGP9_9ROSI